MRTKDLAVVGICAALYAVVGRLTDFGVTFIGVAFWPAAVIPAIFAVLYGPLVGGLGAAIGIFARDMLFHGDPLLSLTAGVSSNFVMFFIIGYFSRRNLDRGKFLASAALAGIVVAAGLLLPTLILPTEFAAFTGLSTMSIISISVLAFVFSLAVIAVISWRWSEWRSYSVGSVIGQGAGAIIVAIGVWAYSQLFFSASGYLKQPLNASLMPIIFVWTFATEIPFVLLVGPAVLKVCYKAFPLLRTQKVEERAN